MSAEIGTALRVCPGKAEPWNAQNFPRTPAARAATAARNDWPSMQGESRQTERTTPTCT
jgi:hypothetical protein